MCCQPGEGPPPPGTVKLCEGSLKALSFSRQIVETIPLAWNKSFLCVTCGCGVEDKGAADDSGEASGDISVVMSSVLSSSRVLFSG